MSFDDWAAEADELLSEIRRVDTLESLVIAKLIRSELRDAVLSAYRRGALREDDMRAIAYADDRDSKARAMLARAEIRRGCRAEVVFDDRDKMIRFAGGGRAVTVAEMYSFAKDHTRGAR